MSIEDVTFLKENSEQTGFIVNIDSSLRDKKAYPLASNFSYVFDQRFQYVYGLNVIDASMPSSMYNIENYNNTLKFSQIWFNKNANSEFNTDNFYRSFFVELHSFTSFKDYFQNVKSSSHRGHESLNTRRIVLGKYNEDNTLPITPTDNTEAANLFIVRTVHDSFNLRKTDRIWESFIVDGAEYYFIGGDGRVITNMEQSSEEIGRLYLTYDENTKERLKKFVKKKDQISEYQTLYRGYQIKSYQTDRSVLEVNVVPEVHMLDNNQLVTYDTYKMTNDEYVKVFNNVSDDNQVKWCEAILQTSSVSLEVGNYDLFTFKNEINRLLEQTRIVTSQSEGTLNFPFSGSQNITFSKPNKHGEVSKSSKLKCSLTSASVIFFFHLDKTSIKDVIGFSSIDKKPEHDAYFNVIKTSNDVTYITSKPMEDNLSEQVILPHGVLYLLGPRYVILRCPEIESHTSDLINSKGIGIFKLSVNQQTVQQRLDFVQYIKRPFNPIEKLTKLTFRFELPDGNLYDFKGIDMFMIIQLNCYVPVIKDYKQFKPILNPDYKPNLIEFQSQENQRIDGLNNRIEESEDSCDSSDEDGDIVKKVNSYMKDP